MTNPTRKVTYKSVDEIDLKLHIFEPRTRRELKSAILFFHGGGFMRGHPAGFYPQCAYLASRGMVAISAEYRLINQGAGSIADCQDDAFAAMRYLRAHATELGINPDQIAVGGGSSGGSLAINLALLELDETTESAIPNVLVFFNPALFKPDMPMPPVLDEERFFAENQLRWGMPPMLIQHGEADNMFPFGRMEALYLQIREKGNEVELIGYPNMGHGFFNHGRHDNKPYYLTTFAMDAFLAKQGFISGNATLDYESLN